MGKGNCCDDNSVIIKQTKELTYFQCKKCNTKFTWGTQQQDEDEISQCKGCHCMTKTIKGVCGKCGFTEKFTPAHLNKLKEKNGR